VARRLFAAATVGGAAALGVPAGRIAPGAWADLVALDVNAPALGGADPQALLDAFVFGASEEAIVATCVAGDWQEHRPPRS
jgi:formimidoylglutamate deiminase